MLHRCGRCEKDDLYRNYHDNEWGVPVHDDRKHFEFLILESFQAGLSWHTILKKREHFRCVCDHFDPHKIARYDESKILELLQDPGIIRHRGKIEAMITNAQIFLDIQKEYGSRDTFIRGYTNGEIINNQLSDYRHAPASSDLSKQISKDLKKRGMKFLGRTIIYAHLQATGQINDHETSCWKYSKHNSLH